MLRKTLVVLRVLVVVYFFGTIIYVSSTPPNGLDLLGPFAWIFGVLIVFLGLTTWIDSIDARLNPQPPVPSKVRKTKAVFALFIAIVAAAIGYWSIQ